METIRKKICLDDFLSHRPGIMPYCEKDSENSDTMEISLTNLDSAVYTIEILTKQGRIVRKLNVTR